MTQLSVSLPGTVEDAQHAVSEAAERWGARYETCGLHGGSLLLPVLHGLQRGLAPALVIIEPENGGTRIRLELGATTYSLNTPAFCFVLLACAGGLLAVVWPLVPRLLPFAPLGAVLAVAGWFQISRRPERTPEDFLRLIEAQMDVVDDPLGNS